MENLFFKEIKTILEKVCQAFDIDMSAIMIKKSDPTLGKILEPVIYCGEKASNCFPYIEFRWDDSVYANGPPGKTVKTGKPHYVRDTLTDESFKPWREKVSKLGIRSCMSIPLFKEEEIYGISSFYSQKENFFDEEKIKILEASFKTLEDLLYNIIFGELALNEKLKSILKDISNIVNEINISQTSKFEIESVVENILDNIDIYFNTDGSQLIIFNEDNKYFEKTIISKRWKKHFDKPSIENDKDLPPLILTLLKTENFMIVDKDSDYLSISCKEKGLSYVASISSKAIFNKRNYKLIIFLVRQENKKFEEDIKPILELFLKIIGVIIKIFYVSSSIKELEEKLIELEYKDALTELVNQSFFMATLKNIIYNSKIEQANCKDRSCIGIAIIDIDNLGLLNSAYGHIAGDLVIKKVGEEIRKSMRARDIVARLSGDEFGIILEDIDKESLKLVLEKIIKNVENTEIRLGEKDVIRATVSIGSSIFPIDGIELDDLINKAEQALYEAKESKPSFKVYSEAQKSSSFNLLKFIPKAFEEDAFVPFFQPIWDIKHNKLYGHEMLARMKVENKVISAYEFIDTVEKLGLSKKLDKYLLEKALTNYKIPLGYKLFANLSAKAFGDKAYLEELKDIIKEKGAYNRIVFEITEREAVPNILNFDTFFSIMDEVKAELAIDDFGSGYSSLIYMKYIKANYLKIDGTFIKELDINKKDEYLVKYSSELAKSFNLISLAEFVENKNILDKLKALGVELAQGYFLGKPSEKMLF